MTSEEQVSALAYLLSNSGCFVRNNKKVSPSKYNLRVNLARSPDDCLVVTSCISIDRMNRKVDRLSLPVPLNTFESSRALSWPIEGRSFSAMTPSESVQYTTETDGGKATEIC